MTAADPGALEPVRLAAIVRAFADASRDDRDRDASLWSAADLLLTELGGDALVYRPEEGGLVFGAFKRHLRLERSEKDRICAEVSSMADRHGWSGDLFRLAPLEATEGEALFCRIGAESVSAGPAQPYFAYLKFPKAPGGTGYQRWPRLVKPRTDPTEDTQQRDRFETCSRTVQLAFAGRFETDDIFPPRMSQAFWNAVDDHRRNHRLIRPWVAAGGAEPQTTASLSFDLRKSTFLMENAIDHRRYAEWVEGLVLLLKALVHKHNGIFDKFTGDGVLAHFPPVSAEMEGLGSADGLATHLASLAMNCAWEMVTAYSAYARGLLPELALTRTDLGACVGLALDNAHWSIDRAGAPIVVGRGVVHACRASGGPAGSIFGTNAVLQALSAGYVQPDSWSLVPFESKEHGVGTKVTLVRFHAPLDLGAGDEKALEAIGERILREVRRRNLRA